MPDVPESATFSIEQDGSEYDVVVSRETVENAIAPSQLTDEAMAGWLQDNLEALSEIARGKLSDASDGSVQITTADWQNRS